MGCPSTKSWKDRAAGRIRGNYLRREVNIIETWSIVHELVVLNAFLDLFWIVEGKGWIGFLEEGKGEIVRKGGDAGY